MNNRPLWQNLVGWGGVVAMVAVVVFVFLTYQPAASTPAASPASVPRVETTLHDAGGGVTCWVMSRGDQILGQGCLR